MKLDHPVLKVNIQNAHSLLDRRYAERVPIRYRITYSGEEGARIVTGEGALKDLSKTGCKILCATTISLGSRLTLLLDLEDGQAPMRLTDVLVSWVDRVSFAVRFPKLSAEERRRLQEIIWKHVRLSSLSDALYSNCVGATEVVEDVLIRRDGVNSEQIYPHYAFRANLAEERLSNV